MMNRIDDTELKKEMDSDMECPQTPTNDTLHAALDIKEERSDDNISNDSMTATTAMLRKDVGRLQQSVPAAHGNSSPGNSSPGNCSPGNCSPGNCIPGNCIPGNCSPGNCIPGNCSIGNSNPGNYDNQCDSLIEVKGEFEGVCEEVTPHIESGEFYTTFTFALLKRK